MVSYHRYIILSVIFCISMICACTQSKSIKKAFAFSKQINSGAPPKYKNGIEINRSQTKKYFYLESLGTNKPLINEINYKGVLYNTPEVFLAGNEAINAGINKLNGKLIILTPAKGNNFWRIEFSVPDDQDNKVSSQNKIIIKGRKDGIYFL